MITAFIICILIGVLCIVLKNGKQKIVDIVQETPKKDSEEQNKMSISAKIDYLMVLFFTQITVTAAKAPLKTLVGMVSLAVILCCGMTQLR